MSITERVAEMFPQLLIGGVVGLLGLAVMFLVVNAFGEKKGFMQRIGLMCAGLFGVVLGAGALVVGEKVRTGAQPRFCILGWRPVHWRRPHRARSLPTTQLTC